jgi:D-inositol-3-phosphate glycosyltransferase
MNRDGARTAMRLPVDRPVVLMVAAQLSVPHKGIDLGFQALRRLREKTAFSLLLLGRARPGIAASLPDVHVDLRWAASNAELAMAYRAADVTLIPSRVDNFPYAALESMACGTPFVAFRIGGLVEMAAGSGGGTIVDAFNVVALAEAMRAIVTDSSRCAQMGRAGGAWVERTCQPERCFEQVALVYQEAQARFTEIFG